MNHIYKLTPLESAATLDFVHLDIMRVKENEGNLDHVVD